MFFFKIDKLRDRRGSLLALKGHCEVLWRFLLVGEVECRQAGRLS